MLREGKRQGEGPSRKQETSGKSSSPETLGETIRVGVKWELGKSMWGKKRRMTVPQITREEIGESG